jgi:hypothetical protein
VARNGDKRQRRPRIELTTPAASPEEAAAVTAAVERFLAETAPPAAAAAEPEGPWLRAALCEGAEKPSPGWGSGDGWASVIR